MLLGKKFLISSPLLHSPLRYALVSTTSLNGFPPGHLSSTEVGVTGVNSISSMIILRELNMVSVLSSESRLSSQQ